MAIASTYAVFPNDVRLQRISLGNDDDDTLDVVPTDERRRTRVGSGSRPSSMLQAHRQTANDAGTPIVANQQQSLFNSSKKSLSSLPFDLLRWFNPKSRRKDKETPASTPSPVSGVVTATGNVAEEGRPYLDDDLTQERILDIDLTPLVILPTGVELNEWLATHTMSFFEQTNLVYGGISEFCCQSSICTSMIGPGNTQYHWIDERGKRVKCTAPQYVDYVMSLSHKLIYDEAMFPTKYGNLFPSSFEANVKKTHRLLLHVIAHIYQCHWQHLAAIRLLAHVNTLTYHFLLFNKQFSLVDDKEMEVLDDLFDRLQFHSSSPRRLACKYLSSPDDVPTSAATSSSNECLTEKSPAEDNKENVIDGGSATDGLSTVSAVVT